MTNSTQLTLRWHSYRAAVAEWETERVKIMSREEVSGAWADDIQGSDDDAVRLLEDFGDLADIGTLLESVNRLSELDSDVWIHNACHFTETEVRAISGLLFAAGLEGTTISLLEQWIENELEDGEAAPGQFVIDESTGALIDNGEEMDSTTTAR